MSKDPQGAISQTQKARLQAHVKSIKNLLDMTNDALSMLKNEVELLEVEPPEVLAKIEKR